MNRAQLADTFVNNHKDFVNYICSLPATQQYVSVNGKWSPAMQLGHIYLTILPFTKVLASKQFIKEKFGAIDRPLWDEETVIANYMKTSRKAPEIYDPALQPAEDTGSLKENINAALQVIKAHLDGYTEDEMDTLVLPHPLLGKLTIREMFYLMAYHPNHHLKQIAVQPS